MEVKKNIRGWRERSPVEVTVDWARDRVAGDRIMEDMMYDAAGDVRLRSIRRVVDGREETDSGRCW